MVHEILPVGPLQCNCSILGDEQTREAIVVDPGDDIDELRAILDRHGLTVKAIVITHAHIDHIGGAARLKFLTGAPVLLNERDQAIYDQMDMQAAWLGIATPSRTDIDSFVREGDLIHAGAIECGVMHTPGHTPGSVCLWMPAEKKLLAGDTLFRDSIGRTDLPGGDGRKILASIRDKLFPLPDEAVVIPGHGPVTTIGREKEFNFFLQGL